HDALPISPPCPPPPPGGPPPPPPGPPPPGRPTRSPRGPPPNDGYGFGLMNSRSMNKSIDCAMTSTASSAPLSNACAAPWMTVRAVGTLAALSFVKKSMLDDTGTVVSASPWMKIVGSKLGPIYVVGDAAAIASGVEPPSPNRPRAICALASG